MLKILVDNEVSEGLPTEIEVIWDGGSFSQLIDDWRVYFMVP